MSTTDWKAQLGKLSGQTDEEPSKGKHQAQTQDTPAKPVSDVLKKQSEPVVIRFERRGGKPTTIISRVEGNPETVGVLAAKLKKGCGTGGSYRDDEILIQGDVRRKVASLLENEGYKVKGDIP
ncbi:MAG: translation initiation factor [Bacteroidales bacterium]|jgi:translation initiation factor 1|nr:translation initiation factor [Bacteroidales bacterium]